MVAEYATFTFFVAGFVADLPAGVRAEERVILV